MARRMVFGSGIPTTGQNPPNTSVPAEGSAQTSVIANDTSGLSRRRGLRQQSKKGARRQRKLAATKKRLLIERGERCEAGVRYYVYAAANGGFERNTPIVHAESNCQRRGTELHHIAGRDFKQADGDFNLLLLCSNCHRLATDADPVAYLVGLVRRSWDVAA